MRDPNRIDKFCDELKTIWHQVPDWRFGQLINNVTHAWNVARNSCPIFYAEDDEFFRFMNEYLRRLKMKVEVGDKLRILIMHGEPQYTGKEGTIEYIDDAGQIHGTWGGCALIPGEDVWEIINESK